MSRLLSRLALVLVKLSDGALIHAQSLLGLRFNPKETEDSIQAASRELRNEPQTPRVIRWEMSNIEFSSSHQNKFSRFPHPTRSASSVKTRRSAAAAWDSRELVPGELG
ncbi:hypothetical protein J3459_006264 [Metarhizium acridum]|uniref:uncharacterized protein n=1 Tax=Metarhizium acridum TaxID=92637 RepID=UPI001C6B7383|nr:hypothetical protein J3458_005465 [Metarhizium acridum]KAG8427897.1 hypothetical protein J3459_006264 [Metarhizium acridum]